MAEEKTAEEAAEKEAAKRATGPDLSRFRKWNGPVSAGVIPRPIPAKGLVAFVESTSPMSQVNAREKGWLPAEPGEILNEGDYTLEDGKLTYGDVCVMVRTEEFDLKQRAAEAADIKRIRASLVSDDTPESDDEGADTENLTTRRKRELARNAV